MEEGYMRLALKLAEKGRGRVSPNPMVGAVIEKEGRIIGEGYHHKYGGIHGEIDALDNAKEDVRGSTLYVNLEPCSHYGKTPPCVDRIIEEGIKKVVIGLIDPNPLVEGRGMKKLMGAGIEVVTGVLEKECRNLNEIFVKYISENRPFVMLKTAMSLDGKIATKTGESRWITGLKSRQYVHRLRNEFMGIMVGINTVIMDNPQLTCRIENGKNPIRIIVDSNLRIPMDSKVLQNQGEAKTIIATTDSADATRIERLGKLGIKVIINKSIGKRVDLRNLMANLAKEGIDSILLEGGSNLNYSALEQGIVDKVQFYIAPKIIGGYDAKTPIGGRGVDSLKDIFDICKMSIKRIDEDVLIEGYIRG